MSMMSEFKEFAMKGNVVDLAVGIVIGGAFGKIVSSLVKDVITPVIGVLTAGIDFSNLKYVLKKGVGEAPDVVMSYGVFLQSVFDFIIVAFAIFMVVKGMNNLRKEEKAEEAPAELTLSAEEKLLTEIRDALVSK